MKSEKQNDEAWIALITSTVKTFCRDYKVVYAVKARERAASFEIGCLHMLLNNYEEVGTLRPENLNEKGEFRYLTSPNGNPDNFSWMRLTLGGVDFQIRQQVRVKSHWHSDIAFCPDIVVLKPNTEVEDGFDPDYASGKRKFFVVSSEQVVTAHECKSLSPFPELLVAFTGMFQAAHKWFEPNSTKDYTHFAGDHPAPCLFIGGDSRPIQRRMITALEVVFPINIVSGLHWSRFKMSRENGEAKYLADALFAPPEDISNQHAGVVRRLRRKGRRAIEPQ
ncbi:MAG: hypothetical protein ABIT37_24385 [Luteolibacter sp.]